MTLEISDEIARLDVEMIEVLIKEDIDIDSQKFLLSFMIKNFVKYLENIGSLGDTTYKANPFYRIYIVALMDGLLGNDELCHFIITGR